MITHGPTPGGAVFLSYASQDAEAARRICEGLRAAGIEIWFDQHELRGGDEWDAKIKRQIRECALFIPIISRHTQARTEGYFRREWNLATQRVLDMAPGRPFLLPVVIDDTLERDAVVQEEILKVQWTRLPGGRVTPGFIERSHALLEVLALGTVAPMGTPIAQREPTRVRPPVPRRRLLPWLAGCTVVALAIGWAFFFARQPTPDARQLAVLPFTAIGDVPANQAFSEGLSETITAQLTQLEQLQQALLVIPTAEVRKEAVRTPSEARALFGATVVLTGSVQRAASTMRVTLNLIDAVSLRIVRSDTFDQSLHDLYRLQDRVAARAAEWLGLKLSESAKRALASGQTTVASAYELYVQSRGEMARNDSAGIDAAITHLHQALQADAQYALAHAALGEAFWLKYLQTKERHWVEEAKRSCDMALQHGAMLATPRITLATLLAGIGQYEAAVAEAQAALRLDPVNVEATRALARAYERLNRPTEAEAAFKRAIEGKPDNHRAVGDLAVFYWRTGRSEDAERMFRRLLELTPENHVVYRNLGGLYVTMGQQEKAAELLERSIGLRPTWSAYSNLGTLRFLQGRFEEAASLFEGAIALNPREYLLHGNMADALRFVPPRTREAASAYRQAILLAENALLVNPKDSALHSALGRYEVFSGNTKRALERVAQARALSPQNGSVLFNAALVYEMAGDRGNALAAVDLALKAGHSRANLLQHPDLQNLRADPGFAPLVAAAGTEPP